MAQSDPVATRALFVLRPGNGNPATGPATGPVTAPLPVADPVTQPSRITGSAEDATGFVTGSEPGAVVTPLPVPLTPAERAHLAVRHWAELAANGAGRLWLHPDRLGHSLYHGKPGSLAEHRAYIKSREWVPPDLDGKAAKFIAGTGIVFYTITGILQIPLLILYAALDRALRLVGLIAAVLVFAIAVVPHIPLI
jgi:hypothetical protein